ncbi:MAG: hypothetical protein HYU58_16730 [Proteobacteria bacterium]|nr:hypothetical protein [Pseudomonadota bacterium]
MANTQLPIVLAELLLAVIAVVCLARIARLFALVRANVFAGAAGDLFPRVPHANRIAFVFGTVLLLFAAAQLGRWNDGGSVSLGSIGIAILCTFLGLRLTLPALARQRHMRAYDASAANHPILVGDRLALGLLVASVWLFWHMLPMIIGQIGTGSVPSSIAILTAIPIWLYGSSIVQPEKAGWLRAKAARDYFDLFAYGRRGIAGWIVTAILLGLLFTPATEWLSPAPPNATMWPLFYTVSLTLMSMSFLTVSIALGPKRLATSPVQHCVAMSYLVAGMLLVLAGCLWGDPTQQSHLPRQLGALLVGGIAGLRCDYTLDRIGLRAWLQRRERQSMAIFTSTDFARALAILCGLYLVHAARESDFDIVVMWSIALHFFLIGWIISRLCHRSGLESYQ